MWEKQLKGSHTYDYHYLMKRWGMDQLNVADVKEHIVKLPVVLGDGSRHIIVLQFSGEITAPYIKVSSADSSKQEDILSWVENWLQWDIDLAGVAAHFVGSDLERLFYAHAGTPIVKDTDLYYCLMKTIIHQQLNLKFAYTLSNRFVEAFGTKEDDIWFYPSPENVASLTYDDLRKMQFSQRKAEYVIDTSRLIIEGKLDLTQLFVLSNEEIAAELTKIRGLGSWSAQNWMLFGLGRADLLPAADIGVQNALKFYDNLTEKPTPAAIHARGERWAPYRSYATMALWRSIET
ncbi:DNA-3-methyladenine glycosylase [Terribacillus saccharophilus]|uniref:DNA-3-methyladenine glycosylase family protein n=1 Tax=Terribacillus saccharophilus TaxID=361277 RepID=UPI000BA5912F|nr:DNA-3-methyladenine glycosylase [Terribacillus saccharophilus]PAF36042.1 DNA-3-methyladenine glycosylase [Terribacillus saccharophilus]